MMSVDNSKKIVIRFHSVGEMRVGTGSACGHRMMAFGVEIV